MSPYAGIDPATLQTRLTEAQDALHAIGTGQQIASVRLPSGLAVSYHNTAASLSSLKAYIRDLQIALGLIHNPGRSGLSGFYITGGKGL